MTVSFSQQMNSLEDANFKLSLAKGMPKNSYLASGVDYYAPQEQQAPKQEEKKSDTKSVPYFIASSLGLVALCAFMPEIRCKLANTKCFKDFDNLHNIGKSDKFLGKLKLGFMKTVEFISDKVMSLRTSFKARKM